VQEGGKKLSVKSLTKRVNRVEKALRPNKEVRAIILMGTREEIRLQREGYREAGIVPSSVLVIDMSDPDEDESEEV